MVLTFPVLLSHREHSILPHPHDVHETHKPRNNEDRSYSAWLLLLSISGVLASLYFIYAEHQLSTLCPLCTIVHFISFLTLYIFCRSFINHVPRSIESFWFSFRFLTRMRIFLVFGLFTVFLFWSGLVDGESEDLIRANDQIATCISTQGLVMYGSPACSHCQQQKAKFGVSFDRILFVSCDDPIGKFSCEKRNVTAYPTWIKHLIRYPTPRGTWEQSTYELAQFFDEDLSVPRLVGVQSIATLVRTAGCIHLVEQ